MFLIIIITARYLVYTHFSQANADVRNAYTRPKLGLRMPEFSPALNLSL